MSILLTRNYQGYQAGQTVTLGSSTESALIAQGIAQTAVSTASTTGAVTANVQQGKAAIAAGAASVTVTNSLVDANSKIFATVAQATADTTLTGIVRIVPAAGSFTLYGPANATATTLVDWSILPATVAAGS